jgi:NAD(P)-dependent dehydrogenase (short-subunit alcohol dehydrogenase family)
MTDPGTYWHSKSLATSRAVVTGAGRGIGRGVAHALLERGASVLLVDRSDVVADAAAEFAESGFDAHHLVADLRDRTSPTRVIDAAVEQLGGITALVNNAMATREPKPFMDIAESDFDLAYEVGPRATFFMMQAAYPHLLATGGGAIVNFGSGSGTAGEPGWGAYAGAKEAIRGMSKVAALEWGKHNIRVNVVCPFANSDGVQYWQKAFPEDYERAISNVPLMRVGDTHTDIGAVVAFLLSEDASYLTNQTIHVDGGTGSFR